MSGHRTLRTQAGRIAALVSPALASALLLAPAGPAFGQAPSAANPPAAVAMPATPTTRVLAIGRRGPAFQPATLQPLMPQEVKDTVGLYLKGKIVEWYVRKDQAGVVFILDATSVEDARASLDQLPLVKARQLEFDLIPMGPLAPLAVLLR